MLSFALALKVCKGTYTNNKILTYVGIQQCIF